jgi:histidinol-phosphatase (PHP family)
VKVWGPERPAPRRDRRFHYEVAMEGIAESDVAIEVSTAGLRKAAREIYPAPAFLAMCLEVGRPVALSSDAHTPNDLGYRYEEAVDLLGSLGVEEIAVFERRERTVAPLGWS